MLKMPFGKHKGQNMEDVPASYLLWLYEDGCNNFEVRNYIEQNIAGIKKQVLDGSGEV